MREIKFRARFIEDNKWCYFSLADISKLDGAFVNYNDWTQSTGLKDKNGTEIYEGDVLRSRENDEVWRVDGFIPLHRHDYVTNIGYFSNGKYHPRENPAGRYSQSDNLNDWLSWPEMYEVIGNVYENPELLK